MYLVDKRISSDPSVQLPSSLRSLRTEIITQPVRGLCNATYGLSTGYGFTNFPNL